MDLLKLKQKIINTFLGGEYGKLYMVYQKIFHARRVERFYEKKVCHIRRKGKHKFLIIRQPYDNTGLMANLNYVLVQLDLYEKSGRIPVVDMKNYKSLYHEEGKVGLVNTWELFFEPLSKYSLEDAYQSNDYILSGISHKKVREKLRLIDKVQTGDRNVIEHWSRLYKKYIRLNSQMQKLFDDMYYMLFFPIKEKGEKILGVKFRGTDYIYDLCTEHNIQPSVSRMIEYARASMEKFECKYIFLSTEDLDIREAFAKEFKDVLLSTNCSLGHYGYERNRLTLGEIAAKEVGCIQAGVDYLMEIMLLSRCDSLLEAGNNGTFSAIIINGNKYDFIENINLGKRKKK